MSDNTVRVTEESSFRAGTIAILGPVNAGKSTLLNKIIGEKVTIVSSKPHTTRNRIACIENRENSQLVFFDTPGFLPRRNSEKGQNSPFSEFLENSFQAANSEADIVVWMLDGASILKSTSWKSAKDLSRVVQDFKNNNLSLPKVIVINKIDVFEKEDILELILSLDKELKNENINVEFLPISAKTGDGVEQFLELLETKVPVGEAFYPDNLNSLQSLEQRASEIIREKLFLQLHQELPYGTAVVVEDVLEEKGKLKIFARIIVEKNSHKGVVIGKNGSRLVSIGKASRIELEKIFNKPIFLKLFVKVEESWRKTIQGLEKVELTSN